MSSDDGYKLFVGSLPADCTSEELHAVFSTYGVVTHVHVMNPHPRSGQRCAFVFYTTKAAGDDACKVLDNQYRIRTDAAQPIVDSGFDAAANGDCEDGPRRSDPPEDGHKLFVGNLPADLSEEELRLVFGTYGEVVHCHIMSIHPKSGLRCAFVYYRDLQSAEDRQWPRHAARDMLTGFERKQWNPSRFDGQTKTVNVNGKEKETKEISKMLGEERQRRF
eukprot:g22514.t1